MLEGLVSSLCLSKCQNTPKLSFSTDDAVSAWLAFYLNVVRILPAKWNEKSYEKLIRFLENVVTRGELYFDFLKWLFLVHLLFVENQLVDGQTSRKIVIFGFNLLFTPCNLNITTNFSKNCLQGVWICVILRNNF